MSLALALALCTMTPPATGKETVVPFRTETAPRIDPVFGDAAAFRARVDRFFTLNAEMERVRDEFSTAVHATLALLADVPRGAKRCPEGTALHYQRALAAGGRYLTLGRQLEAKYHEVRRQDELGETIGLTPDYRWKVRKARELYHALLRDFREMRISFYEQLAAEMRHAGCSIAGKAAGPIDPNDPASWKLEGADAKPDATDGGEGRGVPPPTSVEPPAQARPAPAATAPAAPAFFPSIWIEIDNSRCAEPSRLSIDGVPLGAIGSGKRTSVRARTGPSEICVLPVSDPRPCGAPGTLRKAYLHEGWTLTVRCEK